MFGIEEWWAGSKVKRESQCVKSYIMKLMVAGVGGGQL